MRRTLAIIVGSASLHMFSNARKTPLVAMASSTAR